MNTVQRLLLRLSGIRTDDALLDTDGRPVEVVLAGCTCPAFKQMGVGAWTCPAHGDTFNDTPAGARWKAQHEKEGR
jgi:hypothetical protein